MIMMMIMSYRTTKISIVSKNVENFYQNFEHRNFRFEPILKIYFVFTRDDIKNSISVSWNFRKKKKIIIEIWGKSILFFYPIELPS